MLILSLNSFSQIYIPRPQNPPEYIVSGKDTIGVILTVHQVQKIVNDLQLLDLVRKKLELKDSVINTCVLVIDDYGRKVANLELTNEICNNELENSNLKIQNLNSQIQNLEDQKTNLSQQIVLKDLIIGTYKNERKWWIVGIVGTAAATFALTFFLTR